VRRDALIDGGHISTAGAILPGSGGLRALIMKLAQLFQSIIRGF
jgi:hypothetical protein